MDRDELCSSPLLRDMIKNKADLYLFAQSHRISLEQQPTKICHLVLSKDYLLMGGSPTMTVMNGQKLLIHNLYCCK